MIIQTHMQLGLSLCASQPAKAVPHGPPSPPIDSPMYPRPPVTNTCGIVAIQTPLERCHATTLPPVPANCRVMESDMGDSLTGTALFEGPPLGIKPLIKIFLYWACTRWQRASNRHSKSSSEAALVLAIGMQTLRPRALHIYVHALRSYCLVHWPTCRRCPREQASRVHAQPEGCLHAWCNERGRALLPVATPAADGGWGRWQQGGGAGAAVAAAAEQLCIAGHGKPGAQGYQQRSAGEPGRQALGGAVACAT